MIAKGASLSGSQINCIAWGNSKFVAVSSNGKIAHSTDGMTWTSENNSAFDNGDVIRNIAWGGGKFVAVGYNFNQN